MWVEVDNQRMYRTILIPTDGSDAADSAVEHGYELAEDFGATVHVLYVVDTDQYYPLEVSSDRLLEAFRNEGETVTKTAADRSPHGVDVVTAIGEGSPHQRILEYTDAHDVDLIVMGTHGRRGLGRFLLGSVTEHVLRGASVPVLVTRTTAAEVHVDTPEQARELARAALSEEGYGDVTVLEGAVEQDAYWVVRADADREPFEVYLDRSSGDARIEPVEQR
jgi:nucleotide-binding universal stress UspA family protein